MSPIETDSQKLSVGEYIELFSLDATKLGGGMYYFVPATRDTGVVVWQGNQYTPLDILAEGFEVSGKGTLPRPQLTIGNASLVVESTVRTYGDLLGAVLTRYRTLKKYLDGQPAADPNAHWPPDVYVLEQKLEHNKFYIKWELASPLDVEGQKFPGRQVIRDHCTHVYRRYVVDHFDYTEATCPYAGTGHFDEYGSGTAIQNDKCGKRIKDCQLRFTGTAVLPTRAFPGVARTRY